MNERMAELLQACKKNPPCPTAKLVELQSALAIALPSDYIEFMRESDGAEGFVGENYLMLWSADHVLNYGHYEYCPHFIFFGSDGGGEGFAFDLRESPIRIANTPFIGMDEADARILAENLTEFLERLRAEPLL